MVTERKSLLGRGGLSATLLMAHWAAGRLMAEMTTPFLERSRRSASAWESAIEGPAERARAKRLGRRPGRES